MSGRSSRPGIRRWLRMPLGHHDDVRAEVDEEIGIHIGLCVEELMRSGVSADEARREAERRFGPMHERRSQLHELAEQRHRAHTRGHWWSGLRNDLHVAGRITRRNGALTLISILVLGLGIGVSTAVFSVFDSVILRPLPYRDPSRLVVVWQTAQGGSGEFASGVFDNARDAREWQTRSRSFESLAELTWASGPRVYRPDDGAPRDLTAIATSDNFFEMLGVRAELGRTFTRGDADEGCAVVLSHAFWQSTFGSDANVLGRHITLGDSRCAIRGVMPASFEFYPRQTELWSLMTPLTDTVLARHPDHYLVGVFGRLRPRVSAAAAQRELRAIQASGPDQTPFGRAFSPTVFDLQDEFTWLAGRNLHTTLVILLGAVALVLVVVCVNVANLSLGRAAAREREFAVRIAIGSGRWRLMRQLFVESAVVAGCGAILGLSIAIVGIGYINRGSAIELPPGGAARLDAVALIATIAMTAFATIVVGLTPALRATRLNTPEALKSSSRGASVDRRSGRVASMLVVCQVSVSVMLLVAAALLTESLARLGNAPLGYSPDNLLTMRVDIGSRDTLATKRAFADALDRVHAIPGVSDAAWTSVVPPQGRGSMESIKVDGRAVPASDSIPDVGSQSITETYFDLLRVPVLTGRAFERGDDERAPTVAIVNRAFVDRYLRGENAVGHRIKFGGANEPWLTIVGVVGNEQRATVTREMGWISPPMVFRPMAQSGAPRTMRLVLRAGSQSSAADAVQRAVISASRDAVITDVETMRGLLDRFLASPRTRAESVAALALLAFTLAVIGLYGVLSQVVIHRTREIGIRIALGARPEQVVLRVVSRGVLLAAIGVVAGCMLAVPAVQTMRALLYGVTTFDPATLAGAALAMLTTAVIASALPARRAAAVDPAIALRSE